MDVKQLLLLGMGSIQKALIELLNHENHKMLSLPAICICPEDIPEHIMLIKPDLKHIKKHITADNVVELLEPLLNPNVFVIDLTVNVETIDIIVLCKKYGVMYINTSLEKYNKDESNMDPEKTTLYYQQICLNQAIQQLNSDSPVTIIHSMGMNPGAISALMYQGIEAYCKTYRLDLLPLLEKGDFNLVAKEVLDTGHISEYDNQIVNLEAASDKMINSWSAAGLVAEALCTSFVSSNKSMTDYEQSKYNSRIYYSPKHKSIDQTTKSICLYPDGTPFQYNGFMVTHYEVVSLSQYLSVDDYVPWLSYVYSPSPITKQCVEFMKNNNYTEPQDNFVFTQQNIINKDSFDSIGALCHFRDGRKFWCGTVLTNSRTIEILGHTTPISATQLQVAISVLAGIEWILENPAKGVITAESIPYKYILQRCIPYWGHFYCKEITTLNSTNYQANYTNPQSLNIDSIM